VTGQWFSPGTLVSSTNKTDRNDTTEILLKVALITINQTKPMALIQSGESQQYTHIFLLSVLFVILITGLEV